MSNIEFQRPWMEGFDSAVSDAFYQHDTLQDMGLFEHCDYVQDYEDVEFPFCERAIDAAQLLIDNDLHDIKKFYVGYKAGEQSLPKGVVNV